MEFFNRGKSKPAGSAATNSMSITLSPPPANLVRNAEARRPTFEVNEAPQDKRKHAVVIGAGLGGLSTGIHLARQGWKVTILEKNERVGGRMNVIREHGFSIDMGPTMLMMPDVMDDLFKSCGRRREDYFETQRLTPAYSVHWPDGTRMDLGCSQEDLIAEAKRIAPEDAAKIPALVKAKDHASPPMVDVEAPDGHVAEQDAEGHVRRPSAAPRAPGCRPRPIRPGARRTRCSMSSVR